MAGRRPTPTHLRLVKGNPGKRPVNAAEPKPAREIPSPPAHISTAARVAWGRLTGLLDQMGVLTQADAYALERLAELYAEIVDLTAALATHGRVYESSTESGGTIVRPRPEAAMLADADRRFRAYLIEFGLTPAARSKVRGNGGEEEADPAAAYFR